VPRDLKLKREVAIKILPKTLREMPTGLADSNVKPKYLRP
jgi:hypothetical protein